MTKFRKIPVTIDAIQWTGENLRDVINFTDGQPDTRTHHAGMMWDQYADLVARDGLKIFTLEGEMNASVGDWIIRGIKGEYYPCKPDIFSATYVPADFQPEAPPLSAALEVPEVAALVDVARASRIILAEHEPHPLPVLGRLLAALSALDAAKGGE